MLSRTFGLPGVDQLVNPYPTTRDSQSPGRLEATVSWLECRVADRMHDVICRPSPPWRRWVPAAALIGCASLSAACAGGSTGQATGTVPTTVPPTTRRPPVTRPRTPPTTRWVAKAPQSTPDAAAGNLMSAWASGDRAAASQVGAPVAVATLFALPYPGGPSAIPRGCSNAFPPIVCTYGPPGGGPTTSALFQLYVSQTVRGWYVSSVMILH
jgi:hypothetical protein